ALHRRQVLRAEALWSGDPTQARRLLEDDKACPPDLRDAPWRRLLALCRRDAATLPFPTDHGRAPPAMTFGNVNVMALSPDGRFMAQSAPVSALREGRRSPTGEIAIHVIELE